MEKITLILLYIFLSSNLYGQEELEGKTRLKAYLKLNKKNVNLGMSKELTWHITFKNFDKRISYIVPDSYLQFGFKEDGFVDSDYYLQVYYSATNTEYKEVLTNYSNVSIYQIVRVPTYLTLKKGQKITYDEGSYDTYYNFSKKGYYKVWCVFSPHFGSIKSNVVKFRIK